MADSNPSAIRILSWARQGLGVNAGTPTANGEATVSVRLRLNHATEFSVPVVLFGPGDVSGIDPRAIIRTEPHHFATNFEPNYFPAVEFDRPDFPWLFTPTGPDEQRRLMPWICLVVVAKEVAVLNAPTSDALPVLDCPVNELPDLGESWAWAHAQIVATGDDQADLSSVERSVSRLLCPRRLHADTSYYACVVPTFESGRKVGLGDVSSSAGTTLQPAWISASSPSERCRLPIYYYWEFRTGSEGDFEALVRRLHTRDDLASVGVVPVDLRAPGWGMSETKSDTLNIVEQQGALRVTKRPAQSWDPDAHAAFTAELANIVRPTAPAIDKTLLLGPTWYGQAYLTGNLQPPWSQELNLDPRNRIAAGLGAQVVRIEQESLAASAWEQLAEHREQNAKLQRLQLSEVVGRAMFTKNFQPLGAERLLQVLAPVRIAPTSERASKGTSAQVGPSSVISSVRAPNRAPLNTLDSGADGVLSAAFRRLNRVAGVAERNWRSANWDGAAKPEAVLNDTVAISEKRASPTIASPWHHALEVETSAGNIKLDRWQELALSEREKLAQWGDRVLLKGNQALAQNDPVEAALARAKAQSATVTSVDPVRFAPVFSTPMYAALRDHFKEFLLPGMAQIPLETVTLLGTNPAFIESFLVGLNHELGRELLWRGYPVDLKQTYFRQFWDPRGRVPRPTVDELKKFPYITPIGQWQGPLGTHLHEGNAAGLLVLLIRGELLRRYSGAMIYAAKAKWVNGERQLTNENSDEKYPIFRLTHPPDVTLLLFLLDENEARGADTPEKGEAGWFFVIQEQPTELRFGLDVGSWQEQLPSDWGDLTWGHIAKDAETLHSITHVPITGRLTGQVHRDTRWGANSTEMALITRQPAFRAAIHARTWFKAN
jgi:hypothetical protein